MKLPLDLQTLRLTAVIGATAMGLSLSFGTVALAQTKPIPAKSQSTIAPAQTKLTLSVPEFKSPTIWWWWGGGTANDLAAALSNELTATGKFSVVERNKLGAVLSEQELAELGLTRPSTSAKKGQLTGAKYIVLGQVTSYEEGVASKSSGIGVGGIRIGPIRLGGNSRKSSQEAYIAIDLRVVDSTTGEVAYARTIEGRATSTSSGGGLNIGIGGIGVGGNEEKTQRAPVGKALRAALIEATNYLSCVMVDKGSCIAEFEAKEQKRRDSAGDVLKLD
jgi:curli biogenesis system outer membrane secretion channel CsgG